MTSPKDVRSGRGSADVLVVDDDDDVRAVVSECLRKSGYAVTVAAHGQEALERLRGGPAPALLIVDLMMPVMDGWTLLARLRDDASLSAIPVIVMSAGGELALQSVSATAQIAKPVDHERLMMLVTQLAPPSSNR